MRVKSKFFQTISPVQLVVLTLALVGLGFGIGVDTTGKAYVTGGTASTNFPTTNTLQWNINGDMPGATTTQNSPPTADAGPDQTVRLGATVQLDGSQSSDPDGDPLTFNWEIISKPPESNAVILDPNAVRPTLLVDVVGEYVVRLIVNDGMLDSEPDTVMISVAEDFISYGQTRAGRIDFPGERDPYRFNGNEGKRVLISASSNDGFNPVRAEVFNPSGERIGETPDNGRITVTLPQSVTYTILVRSSNPVAVGRSYGVSLQCIQGQCGTEIACGQTLPGGIALQAEHDPYVFSGNAGDVVVIAASSNDGFNPVRAEVFDPSGEKIAETPNNGSVTVTLPQSGTYTILVRSSNPVAVGRSYGVSRACL